MKKQTLVLFSIIALLSVKLVAQEKTINWMTMEEALKAQAKEPRKIMMDAYTDWCGPCKMLDKNTFQNPDVVDFVNKHFYAVKFNAEGKDDLIYKGDTFTNPEWDASRGKGRNAQHQFAQALGIKAYPSIVFFDEEGNPIGPIPGYKTPQELELYLKLFLKDDYKNIKTEEEWAKYQKDFKPEFKG